MPWLTLLFLYLLRQCLGDVERASAVARPKRVIVLQVLFRRMCVVFINRHNRPTGSQSCRRQLGGCWRCE